MPNIKPLNEPSKSSVKAVVWLMQLEGWDASDHLSDHGKLTKFGVSSRYFPAVKSPDFSFFDACKIYEDEFIMPMRIESLVDSHDNSKAAIGLMIFQMAVHVGPASAKSVVQATAHGLSGGGFLKTESSLISYSDSLSYLVGMLSDPVRASAPLLALKLAMGGYYSQRRSSASIKPIYHAFLNRTYANASFVSLSDSETSRRLAAFSGDVKKWQNILT